MARAGGGGCTTPLLGTKPAKSLRPLFTVTFFQAIAFFVAKQPALSLRVQEFAAADGWEASAVAAMFGRMTALRSLLEFFFTPMLASWSDKVGRRPIMCLSCLALCVECSFLALSRSLVALFVVHVAFGLVSDSNGTLEGSCIADATPQGEARVIAFGQLFTVVGAAVVLGPAIGGELAARSGVAPLVAGCLLSCCSLAYMLAQLPEYFTERHRRLQAPSSTGSSMPADFVRLLTRAPGLPWYVLASALSNMSVGAFSAVFAFWAKESLGWDGRDLGRFLAWQGLMMMAAQSVLLPRLIKLMHGREAALAQLCLLVQASRHVAYAVVPSGMGLYAASLATAAGLCHSPVLRSLCSRAASPELQGLLSGGTAAVSTAAQVLGSLLGSQVFAVSLRNGLPLWTVLLLSASCSTLGAVSVAQADRAASAEKAAKDSSMAAAALGA